MPIQDNITSTDVDTPSTQSLSAFGRSSSTEESLLWEIESGNFELPVLPDVCSRLLALCSDANWTAKELTECIRSDQSMTTHLLRVANSTMYGGDTPTVSLHQAISRLGINRIREIVIVISCKIRLFEVEGYEDEVLDSFRMSLAAATYSQELARILRRNVEDAFLCGLLHDIGRPILLQKLVDIQKRDGKTTSRQNCISLIDEWRIPMARRVIEHWNLPTNIGKTVVAQSQLDKPRESIEEDILLFGIELGRTLLDGIEDRFECLSVHPGYDQLNLYPQQLRQLLDIPVMEMIESV